MTSDVANLPEGPPI